MKKAVKGAVIAAGAIAMCQIAEAAYFYRRTMQRGEAKTERTIKMAGTDWNQYMPMIQERRDRLQIREHEDVYCQSEDGLELHATYYPGKEGKKLVICFHGYTSEGTKDFNALSDYYFRHDFGLLLVDARAHGLSEGKYIGFGCLDRHDALRWIAWAIRTCGEDVGIMLHGISMGGATVLMTSGLTLPKQVKGIISDCGFTSPKYVFTHVLRTMYHLPAFPLMQISDYVNRRKAGYGMDECNAAREVQKATVPILMIHGSADTFVPCSMCEEIYENCNAPKSKLIVEGAAHAESYYKDTEAYEKAMDELLEETGMK